LSQIKTSTTLKSGAFLLLMLITGFSLYAEKNDLHPSKKGFAFESKTLQIVDQVQDLWYLNPDSSVRLARKGMSIDTAEVVRVDRALLYFSYAIALKSLGRRDSVRFYLEKSNSLFKQEKQEYYYYRSLEQIANLHREEGNYDRAIEMLEQCNLYFERIDDPKQINSTLINIGNAWLDKGRYIYALNSYMQAAKYDSLMQNNSTAALNKLGIGLVYHNLAVIFEFVDKKKSKAYFNQALENIIESRRLFSLEDHMMGVCYTVMNEASVWISLKRYEKVDSLLQASSDCILFPDEKMSLNFKVYSAEVLNYKNQKAEALKLFKEVSLLEEQAMYPHQYHDAMLKMADLLREINLNDSAYRQAERSMKWLKEKKIFHQYYESILKLGLWYAEDGAYDISNNLLKEAIVYKDSIFQEVSNEIFDDYSFRYQQEFLKNNMQKIITQKELENKQFKIGLLFSAVSLLLLLTLTLILVLRRRSLVFNKKLSEEKNIFLEQENKMKDAELVKIKMEKELNEEKANSHQLELQLKEQQLVFQSLKGQNSLKYNRDLLTRLGAFQHKLTRKKDQDDYGQLLSDLGRESERNNLADFEEIFMQMHGGFYEKLIEIGPELKRSELQMCALLRLNLPSKEIASIMSMTISSVDLTRHHIRKKLKLDSTQNLTSYLIML
jgi:tetratricopeptide (TPR) repeat protein/DNA-binding CsgD family transcriptional regulator